MEVLGASFSNLQLAQQSSSLANINSLHPNVASSFATNFIPQPNSLPVQTAISVASQTQACMPSSGSNNPQFSQIPAPMCSQRHTTRNLPSAVNGASVNYQVLPKCSVKLCHLVLLCKQYLITVKPN